MIRELTGARLADFEQKILIFVFLNFFLFKLSLIDWNGFLGVVIHWFSSKVTKIRNFELKNSTTYDTKKDSSILGSLFTGWKTILIQKRAVKNAFDTS